MLALSPQQNCQRMWSKQITQRGSCCFPCPLKYTFSCSVDSTNSSPSTHNPALAPSACCWRSWLMGSVRMGNPKTPQNYWDLETFSSSGPSQQFPLRFPRLGHSALSASLCDLSSPECLVLKDINLHIPLTGSRLKPMYPVVEPTLLIQKTKQFY